jgi:hypothetical protein
MARAPARKLPTKAWSMFAYIGGDNNLSDAGLEDIDEMCAVGASANLHASVEIDTYGDHTGSIRYEISEPDVTGNAYRKVIKRLSERDTGDPKTLVDALKWTLDRYPARNRLAVIWNHGSGFRAPRRDIAFDDFGTSLDMPEVETALRRAGVGTGQPYGPLSIMGFDACLMCMLEVVHHFRGQANYIVGSQQVEPGDGWPYDAVLAAANTAPRPADLAAAIVDAYIADYRRNGVQNVTQSAIDVARTEAVVERLHQFGAALLPLVANRRAAMRSARLAAQVFDYADYVDLIDVATRLSRALRDARVTAAANTLIAAARASVVASKTLGRSVAGANGLSVWFPATQDVLLANRAKYLALHCNDRRQDWLSFLDAYFA